MNLISSLHVRRFYMKPSPASQMGQPRTNHRWFRHKDRVDQPAFFSTRKYCRHLGLVSMLLVYALATAQESEFALRFHGTGVGPPGQQDRLLIAIDDNAPGTAGQTPIDIGAGSFTIELWIRGSISDNGTTNQGGDVETNDYDWIEGNILLDRDIWCGSERKYGVSLAGGLVRFGTSTGDGIAPDGLHTMEGSTQVLDGSWHHIAVVRDVSDGRKFIYVDGLLDFASSAGVSFADLSYPDDGIAVTPQSCGPGQLTAYGWFLVVAAEKHDAGSAYPSFNGFVDELRIWNNARSAAEIADHFRRVVPINTANLVGSYRFEEGSGVVVTDTSAASSPNGTLIAGSLGNGEWVSRSQDPLNTAPLIAATCVSSAQFQQALPIWPTSQNLLQLVAHVNQLCGPLPTSSH